MVPSSTLCRLEILSNAAEHCQITEGETNKSTAAILVINFTFFPISSPSATVQPVKLGLAAVESKKKASQCCCYLMKALVSDNPLSDTGFFFSETMKLISWYLHFLLSPASCFEAESWNEIYYYFNYYQVHLQFFRLQNRKTTSNQTGEDFSARDRNRWHSVWLLTLTAKEKCCTFIPNFVYLSPLTSWRGATRIHGPVVKCFIFQNVIIFVNLCLTCSLKINKMFILLTIFYPLNCRTKEIEEASQEHEG